MNMPVVILATFGILIGLTFIWFVAPMLARWIAVRRLDRRCRQDGVLILTFDDGPGPRLTPKVLDLLNEHGVSATFFCTGFRARRFPGLMDRIATAGHEIGGHSEQHLHAWRTRPGRAAQDLRIGQRTLDRWLSPSRIVRPPYGKITLDGWLTAIRRGWRLGWWTIVNGELGPQLDDPGRSAQLLRSRGGGVVLMHDFDSGPEREAFVLQSLSNLIDTAEEMNLRVLPLGAVIRPAPEPTAHDDRAREADDSAQAALT